MNPNLKVEPLSTAAAALDYSVLKKAVLNACKVVERGNTIPILDTFLMVADRGGVRVIGTDLDLYSTTFVPGQVDADFLALIDAHKLKSVMDKVKDAATVTLSLSGEHLFITIGKVKLDLLHTMQTDDFPESQHFRDKLRTANASFIMMTSDLASMIHKTRIAISTEETRYYLNGIFMHVSEFTKKLTFVSTDGHKLARMEMDIPDGAEAMPEGGVIIPHKTVEEIYRLTSRKDGQKQVRVVVTDTGVAFHFGEDEVLESKVVDGTFPDYVRVIPQRNEHKFAVRTTPLLEAMTQATAIAPKKSAGLKFAVSSGKITLTCTQSDFGSASTALRIESAVECEAGFNSGYLSAFLKQLDGGALFEFGDAQAPVVIRDGADERATYVLMPLRV